VLAEFRADSGRHLRDPAMVRLIADLRGASPAFARAWDEQAVTLRQGGERRFEHPEDGSLSFIQVTSTLSDQPDLKLVLLVPAELEDD
jgi:hypothetical protein